MSQASTIAVIDDDELIRSSMASLIRSLGLDVRTFDSADSFLAAGEKGFACLISDVQMPGTSGLELQQIVATWSDPTPMIVMTAYPERAKAAAMDGGAVCFIEKPVDGNRLVSCLESVLGPID